MSREFVPYKGWLLENGDRDPQITDDEKNNGDCTIVVDKLSHGNWHTVIIR